ncbi:hypothetical protein NPIL_629911 [Nephila pilipes]|uniref:Uncharacterized protein n=1 Tax=Nephila pilipes TaxID=299642 RepID=A0A8X6R568_NEPPI|nr:hypothetical protein NPIL_629911 [Nephila pilipes]
MTDLSSLSIEAEKLKQRELRKLKELIDQYEQRKWKEPLLQKELGRSDKLEERRRADSFITFFFLLDSLKNHVPDIYIIDEKDRKRRVRGYHQLKKYMRKIFHLKCLVEMITQVKPDDPNAVELGDGEFAEYDNLKRVFWE